MQPGQTWKHKDERDKFQVIRFDVAQISELYDMIRILLYEWPGLLLGASDLQGLRASLRRELDNLPPRFAEAR